MNTLELSARLEEAEAQRDNYRRALYAAWRATTEHDIKKIDDYMLITRTAVAIMREVLRGGTLSNTGILRSRDAAPPERDADAAEVAALRAENERLRTIIRVARERLYDAHGRDGHTVYRVVMAVGGILRREGKE